MAEKPEVIRQQMGETRAHLTEKLEALEDQVTGTVQAATDTVSETVEAVKLTVENVTEAVQETVHSVGESLNLRLQTERHPWIVFAGSMAAGCLASRWFNRATEAPQADAGRWSAGFGTPEPRRSAGNGYQEAVSSPAPARMEPQERGWFSEHFDQLKGMAIGTLMGLVRDMASRSLPKSVGPRLAEEIDSLTRHLGGEPIRGTVLPTEEQEAAEPQGSVDVAGAPRW